MNLSIVALIVITVIAIITVAVWLCIRRQKPLFAPPSLLVVSSRPGAEDMQAAFSERVLSAAGPARVSFQHGEPSIVLDLAIPINRSFVLLADPERWDDDLANLVATSLKFKENAPIHDQSFAVVVNSESDLINLIRHPSEWDYSVCARLPLIMAIIDNADDTEACSDENLIGTLAQALDIVIINADGKLLKKPMPATRATTDAFGWIPLIRQIPSNAEPNPAPIPPIIIKTGPWPKDAIPQSILEMWETIQQNNPEYEIQYFSDADCLAFIRTHFEPDVATAFESLKAGAFRADLFRYCAMYVLGGVYSDSTQQFRVPISTLVDRDYDRLVLIRDKPRRINDWLGRFAVQICFMAVAPRERLLYALVQAVTEHARNKDYAGSVLAVSGPICFGYALQSLRIKNFRMELEQGDNDIVFIDTGRVAIETHMRGHHAELIRASGKPHYSKMYVNRQIY
jgi:hypothetical protein